MIEVEMIKGLIKNIDRCVEVVIAVEGWNKNVTGPVAWDMNVTENLKGGMSDRERLEGAERDSWMFGGSGRHWRVSKETSGPGSRRSSFVSEGGKFACQTRYSKHSLFRIKNPPLQGWTLAMYSVFFVSLEFARINYKFVASSIGSCIKCNTAWSLVMKIHEQRLAYVRGGIGDKIGIRVTKDHNPFTWFCFGTVERLCKLIEHSEIMALELFDNSDRLVAGKGKWKHEAEARLTRKIACSVHLEADVKLGLNWCHCSWWNIAQAANSKEVMTRRRMESMSRIWI